MYADNVPPLQAIDPRLPQVAPLDARMFQVCKFCKSKKKPIMSRTTSAIVFSIPVRAVFAKYYLVILFTALFISG